MDISEHQTTCLVGESGAGKSTLLKLLNKMNIPDKGHIRYKGNSLDKVDPVKHRREAVMNPQNNVRLLIHTT